MRQYEDLVSEDPDSLNAEVDRRGIEGWHPLGDPVETTIPESVAVPWPKPLAWLATLGIVRRTHGLRRRYVQTIVRHSPERRRLVRLVRDNPNVFRRFEMAFRKPE